MRTGLEIVRDIARPPPEGKIEVLHPEITQIPLINLCNLWISKTEPGPYEQYNGRANLFVLTFSHKSVLFVARI